MAEVSECLAEDFARAGLVLLLENVILRPNDCNGQVWLANLSHLAADVGGSWDLLPIVDISLMHSLEVLKPLLLQILQRLLGKVLDRRIPECERLQALRWLG